MMINRAFLVATALVSATAALSACSGDDTDGSGGSDSGGSGAGDSGGATSGGGTGAGTSGGGTAGTGAGAGTGATGSGGASETLIGTPCEDDDDCPYEGGWCRTAYTNGYCTKDCSGFGECDGAGTVCEITLGQCHKACTDETEADVCRVDEGYSCVTRDGGSSCES